MIRTAILRTGLLSLAALCAVGITACGSSDEPTSSGPGLLIVGRTAGIDTLDPDAATAFQTEQTLELIYGGLTNLDDKLDVVPGLAASWKFSNGGKRLTFDLRKAVRSADGTTFDSADVKASLDRLLDPKTGAVGASNLSAVSGID